MKRFFNELKELDPELTLKLKTSMEEQMNLFNSIFDYHIKSKTPQELIDYLDCLNKLYDSIEIGDMQLRLQGFDLSKVYTKKVSLDHDFTYTKPESYRLYRGEMIEVDSYHKLYIDLCNYFYELDPVIFRSFPNKTDLNGWRKPYFSLEKGKIRNGVLIKNQVYIETRFSANKIRDLLIKMFNAYNLSFNILEIFIKQDRKEEYGYYDRK